MEPPAQPHQLVNDRGYDFRAAIPVMGEDAKIAIRLDDEPFLSWEGAISSLSVAEAWDIPVPGIFAVGLQRGSVIWHQLELHMHSGQAGAPQ
jgi:hypothetical protein